LIGRLLAGEPAGSGIGREIYPKRGRPLTEARTFGGGVTPPPQWFAEDDRDRRGLRGFRPRGALVAQRSPRVVARP